MLKYLHSGAKKREQIAHDFGISERTLADDLKNLLDGFLFLENTMKISVLERKKNTYHSLIHPIFLALNTSEIYALTVGLKILCQDTVFQDTLNTIADKIYKQLSEYAKNMVDQHKHIKNVRFKDEDLRYISSNSLLRHRKLPFCYFLKEPISCEVTYTENNEMRTITGVMRLAQINNLVKLDRVIIETEEGQHEISINNISTIRKSRNNK